MNTISIRPMQQHDHAMVSHIHEIVFTRQRRSAEWMQCNFNAYPRIMLFVACIGENIVGYIQWIHKSGFCEQAVLELEQIAVHPNYQHQGIGSSLIERSLAQIKSLFGQEKIQLKNILISTRADNSARRLYEKVLGATPAALLKNLYSADEVILLRRDID